MSNCIWHVYRTWSFDSLTTERGLLTVWQSIHTWTRSFLKICQHFMFFSCVCLFCRLNSLVQKPMSAFVSHDYLLKTNNSTTVTQTSEGLNYRKNPCGRRNSAICQITFSRPGTCVRYIHGRILATICWPTLWMHQVACTWSTSTCITLSCNYDILCRI